MAYLVIIENRAQKEFRKISPAVKKVIIRAVSTLE